MRCPSATRLELSWSTLSPGHEREVLIEAVEAWAFPAPNQPTLGFIGMAGLCRGGLTEVVRSGSKDGETFPSPRQKPPRGELVSSVQIS